MTTWKLEHNDVIEWAKGYAGEPFMAMFCDPPYHLTSITKRFGQVGSAPAKGGVYNRASKGFMGTVWDGGNISFRPETWAALGQHLYPGAFGLAFASPRNQHRMVCAIEDAGFIIQPTIYGLCYLSGFPKATRIKGYGSLAFSGHRYGGQALKPMIEPLICFQKPYEGRPIDNIAETGAGTLWIDGGRIATSDITGWAVQPSRGYSGGLDTYEPEGRPVNGRWPGNLYLHHDPACNGECFKGAKFHLPAYECQGFALSPLSEPLYLMERLSALVEVVKNYNTTYNNLSRRVCEVYHSGRKLSAASADGLSGDVSRVLGLSEFLDSHGGYRSCIRFCDERVHQVLMACQDDPQRLPDVLSLVYSDLKILLHNPHYQYDAPLSNLGDVPQSNIASDTPLNKSDSLALLRSLSPEPRSRNGRKAQRAQPQTVPGASTNENSISADDNHKILSGNAGKIEALKLLCFLCFDLAYRFILPADIIQRSEFDVNLPPCPVRLFDEQSGNHPGGSPKTGNEPSDLHKNTYGKRNRVAFAGYEDAGPASRMLFRGDWSYEVAEQLAAAESLRYEPKASVTEREAGLDELPTRIRHRVNSGGLENEPRFAPKEAKNHHPTVKSISVCKYFAGLLLPPAAYAPRRILVPFSGVASEMAGCVLAGWESVTGIESNAAYVEIARARLAWWSQWPGWGQTDVDAILAAAKGDDTGQMSLFATLDEAA